jgi:hypothetical protein
MMPRDQTNRATMTNHFEVPDRYAVRIVVASLAFQPTVLSDSTARATRKS